MCKLANGMVLLCDGATPGEVVRARVTKLRKKLAYGAKTATERAAPNAVTAPCPHYEQCGGCAWQHVNYDAQVEHKRNRVVDVLARIYIKRARTPRRKWARASARTRRRRRGIGIKWSSRSQVEREER